MIFGIFVISYLSLFLALDLLQRYVITEKQWSRKATHILSGGISFMLPVYLSRTGIIIMALFFTLVLGISKYKKILLLHQVSRKTIGEIFYPFSIALIAMICLPENMISFQIAILVLSLSDGFAGIIGKHWPVKTFYFKENGKSVGGAITFFIITSLLLIYFHGLSFDIIFPLLVMSIILTAAEFFLIYGFDNLILPVAASLLDLYFF